MTDIIINESTKGEQVTISNTQKGKNSVKFKNKKKTKAMQYEKMYDRLKRDKNKINQVEKITKPKTINNSNRYLGRKTAKTNYPKFRKKNSINFSTTTINALDLIVNPFNPKAPVDYPDGVLKASSIFKDYSIIGPTNGTDDTSIQSIEINNTGAGGSGLTGGFVNGMLIWFLPGYNSWFVTDSQFVNGPWTLAVSFWNNEGRLLDMGTDADNSLFTLNTQFNPTDDDELTVLGNYYSMARILSTGIRVWPTVEEQTTTGTQTASGFYAGLVSLNDLYTEYWFLGTNIQTMFESTKALKYSNRQAVSVRGDQFQAPWQEQYVDSETMQSIQCDGDMIKVPFVGVLFNQPIGLTSVNESGNFGLLPSTISFTIDMYVWGAGVPMTSIPMYPTEINKDYQWHKAKEYFKSAGVDIYAISAEGHSFGSFLDGVNKFTNHINKYLQTGTKIITNVQKAIQNFN